MMGNGVAHDKSGVPAQGSEAWIVKMLTDFYEGIRDAKSFGEHEEAWEQAEATIKAKLRKIKK